MGPRSGTSSRPRAVLRACLGVIILAGFAGGGWFAWGSYRAGKLRDAADRAYSRGNWMEAARLARAALVLRPHDPRCAALTGLSLTRLGMASEAEPFYKRAGDVVGITDQHVRARALIEARDYSGAIAVYEAILAAHPADVPALRRLAGLRMARNEWSEVLKLAERLRKLPEGEVIGLTLEGSVKHNLGEYHRAVELYQRVLQLDPELREMPLTPTRLFWEQLARDLIRDGRPAEARVTLEAALAHGEDAFLINLVGEAFESEGRLDDARSSWLRALDVDPTGVDPWLNLGRLALRRNQPEEAARYLSRAVALAPNSVDPLYNLAQAYRRLNRSSDVQYLERRLAALRRRQNP